MIKNEDGSITWGIETPVERSDAAYRGMYFACKRIMSQARMQNPNLPGNEAANQLGAFISLITDGKVQNELWEKYDNLVAQKSANEYDWQKIARIRGECAEEVMMDVSAWFARFWSVSETVEIDFVRVDNE